MSASSATGPTLYTDCKPLGPELGTRLVDLASHSIHYGLTNHRAPTIEPENYPTRLQQLQCSFVTLTLDEQLRGCIGALQPNRALVLDVSENAYAAAFQDSRFSPLTEPLLKDLDIHVSVLSAKSPLTFSDERDLQSQLRPTIDGLIIQCGPHQATFLPAVWTSFPEPIDFLRQLKAKAGINDADQGLELHAWRYTTQSFSRRS